jgi:hypothetical protein
MNENLYHPLDRNNRDEHGSFHRGVRVVGTMPSGLLVLDESDGMKVGGQSGVLVVGLYGHQTMSGDARVWRDELGELLTKKKIGQRITENTSEGTVDFAANCDKDDDYIITNVQLNHDRDEQEAIYPHLHFIQAQSGVPNWLIQYRWQTLGGFKQDTWNALPLNDTVFNWTGGAIHQIGHTPSGILPPSASRLSDIVQFRLGRDTSNETSLFTGSDPATGVAAALSFDVHLHLNSFGSDEQYRK